MNTEDKEVRKLITKFSEASDMNKPHIVIGASLALVQTICNYEPQLRQPTADFLRQFAHLLDIQAAGPTEH